MSSASARRFLGVVGTIIGTVGIVGIVLTLYERFHGGRAAELFQNGYGQYETWASYAGSIIGAALILSGSFLVRWLYLWRRSRLEGVSMKEIAKELKRSATEE